MEEKRVPKAKCLYNSLGRGREEHKGKWGNEEQAKV